MTWEARRVARLDGGKGLASRSDPIQIPLSAPRAHSVSATLQRRCSRPASDGDSWGRQPAAHPACNVAVRRNARGRLRGLARKLQTGPVSARAAREIERLISNPSHFQSRQPGCSTNTTPIRERQKKVANGDSLLQARAGIGQGSAPVSAHNPGLLRSHLLETLFFSGEGGPRPRFSSYLRLGRFPIEF